MNNQAPHKLGSVKPTPANYHEPVSRLYRGNPLIEALPAQPDDENLYDVLKFHPEYRPANRKAPASHRQEMLESLQFFFQPLPRHLGLAQGIFKMLRVGYAARNPVWGMANKFPVESAMQSGALVGASGIGKTQSIRHVLKSLKSQVIHHSRYNGQTLDECQVVWLHVECPHDASPRGLCVAFFDKIDKLLGTRYSMLYATNRSSANSMIPALVTVAREHYLGLLVIDEIQNLFRRTTRSSVELQNFIVRIINDLSIPVLMIGTARTASMLTSAFRVTRRCTGLPEPFWDRLKQKDTEWEMFMSELWNYRYTSKDGDNYDKISEAMFDLTQGIPDLAVKLFYLAQMDAINTGEDKLTVELLQEITNKSLVLNRQHLDDLRAGRTPKEEYQYEQVWNPPSFALPAGETTTARKNDKTKRQAKQTAPPVNGSANNLLGSLPGETVYETLKRQGNVHKAEAQARATALATD